LGTGTNLSGFTLFPISILGLVLNQTCPTCSSSFRQISSVEYADLFHFASKYLNTNQSTARTTKEMTQGNGLSF
jgi:hypothetical protein